MKMNNNRKEVDKFLIALNDFLSNEELTEGNKLELVLPLRFTKPPNGSPTKLLKLPFLVPLINKQAGINRRENFIMRSAYAIKYRKVKGNSYEEIFNKAIGIQQYKGIILKDFYKNNPGLELIIPLDYIDINNDLYYKGEYKNLDIENKYIY